MHHKTVRYFTLSMLLCLHREQLALWQEPRTDGKRKENKRKENKRKDEGDAAEV